MDLRNGIEAIRSRVNEVTVAVVLSGVALAACGTDSPHLSVNTAGVEASAPGTEVAATATVDRMAVLPGDCE